MWDTLWNQLSVRPRETRGTGCLLHEAGERDLCWSIRTEFAIFWQVPDKGDADDVPLVEEEGQGHIQRHAKRRNFLSEGGRIRR